MLDQATRNLVSIARNASSTEADVMAATQTFCDAVSHSSVDETNESLAELARAFDVEDLSRAGFLALLCGAYVERGCDPLAVAQPLTRRLRSLLESAAELTDACHAQLATSAQKEQDSREGFENTRNRLASKMRQQTAAWDVLKKFWPPAVAVFSASAKARTEARGLRDLAARIADKHEAGHWLRLLLSVLVEDPILVIEPETEFGILARISGVVDNFQLNVLLMDGFPQTDASAGPRVSRSVADVARGIGPQSTEDIVQGVWNLYTWRAAATGGRLPDPKDYRTKDCWIWNEGVPEDIPVFEGRRVILLGPASYVRTWKSQRMFAGLSATLGRERDLAKDEVAGWLQRMAGAKNEN